MKHLAEGEWRKFVVFVNTCWQVGLAETVSR